MRGYWARPQGPFFTGKARQVSGPRTIELKGNETAIVMERTDWHKPGADREGEATVDIHFEPDAWD